MENQAKIRTLCILEKDTERLRGSLRGGAAMGHKLLKKEDFNSEILREISAKHRLTRCPVCGNNLIDLRCHFGEQSPVSDYEPNKNKKNCERCEIVWTLELHNWTVERGDGMITGEGHALYLTGQSNCYCRRNVIDTVTKFLCVHSSKSGHSRIFLSDWNTCPDFERPKVKANPVS